MDDNNLTTKDAITVLQNLQDWLYFSSMNGGTSIQRKAIDMAIRSLKSQPSEEPQRMRAKWIATTIDPEPHWIPVTERLPNRDELVLVTYKTTNKIHLCKYLDDGSENSWWSYINYGCAWNNMILAWMPLPEPYKGVTE